MGTLKTLVEADCGQPNALVQLGSQVNFKPVTGQVVSFQQNRRLHDEFTHEYLSQFGAANRAQTAGVFSMNDMLSEVSNINGGDRWAREFRSVHQPGIPRPLFKNADLNAAGWTQEYNQRFNPQNQQFSAPSTSSVGSGTLALPNHQMDQMWNDAGVSKAEDRWAVDYLKEVDNKSANEIFGGLNQEDQWGKEFTDFMKNNYEGQLENAWSEAASASLSSEKQKDEFWDSLESQWDSAAKSTEHESWLDDFESFRSSSKDYQFSEEHPFSDVANPLEEGRAKLAQGDLAKAVLLFEEAVRRDMESSEAWQWLGVAQAENEQEESAIAALRKCVSLDPNNLQALMNLSVSLTNESLYREGCDNLLRWLAVNPKYSSIVPPDAPTATSRRISSFLEPETFKSTEALLLRAVRERNGGLDPDLQNALGVLYNMSGDYDKAVECFQVALQINPNEPRIWNRLGATLANGNRSAEAVAAYDRALQQYAGFVRARYNLGIACVNLKSYREAVDHFLSALSLQCQGLGPNGSQSMSDNIWSTLRFAVRQVDNMDAVRAVDNRNFDDLASIFQWHPSDTAGGGTVS